MTTAVNDTIVALATGRGGAIAVIRVSGSQAIEISDKLFKPKSGGSLCDAKGFTLHYGDILTNDGAVLDDVMLSLFHAPRSYTGENMVEISVHASEYIISELIRTLLEKGCRMAEPGEFTLRAYTNGKMDLVQAEAVADVISSGNAAAHRLASHQMRGSYSHEFTLLRSELLNTMSLLELELDFGEEDVEFADRTQLQNLLEKINNKIEKLTNSFKLGNSIKKGIPVAIVGSPNSGKSTLLNTLLGDERAIVSNIAGTTRDIIEEHKIIGKSKFRFIDTAGIRSTTDTIENMGIERTHKAITQADIILLVLDSTLSSQQLQAEIEPIKVTDNQHLVFLLNKTDLTPKAAVEELIKALQEHYPASPTIKISAKKGTGIQELESHLVSKQSTTTHDGESEIIISNLRHYNLLHQAQASTTRALEALTGGLPTDLITQDLRESTHHLGALTGTITTDEILTNIFQNFCIGK